MASLLTARNLPGIGDADPPEDDERPDCSVCSGEQSVWHDCEHGCDECVPVGLVWCGHCSGTGYEPEPEYDPPMEREDV